MDCASYVFPAVRGTQAQREYYVSMVPLDVMSKIFQFADEELPPEIRAQRILNKSRIPEIRDYICFFCINRFRRRKYGIHACR